MSDAVSTDTTREPQAFFGAEQAKIPEELAPETWKEIDDYLARNPGGHERLIPLLHSVQESLGYIPFAVQEYVADRLGLSPIQVYGVISFYHFFTTTPRGKYELKVCMGTACFVRHAQRLVETLEQTLGLALGDVTDDRLFSLEQVRCIGACGLAPAMMVNDETLGNLSPKDVRKRVLKMRAKELKAKKKESSPEPTSE
jgi:NADH:ubiquinone oxidoreductase subunit E